MSKIDFKNTKIAFASRDDRSLKRAGRLFQFMNMSWLVTFLSKFGLIAIKMKLPLVKSIIRATVFNQFCGGESLVDSNPVIQKLGANSVKSIMDYGGEGKTEKEDFTNSYNEILKAIDFGSKQADVPIISMKITGLAPFDLLEKYQNGQQLSDDDAALFRELKERLNHIGSAANKNGVGVFVDAEESWIQDTIDELAQDMQLEWNKNQAIIYNTFQMYRHDKLDYLKSCHEHAKAKNYILGAKLVRGAYMTKERERANAMGYLSPIQKDKNHTDNDYNSALVYCLNNFETISCFNATHNEASTLLLTELMTKNSIEEQHPHFNFCQLYGMSDHLTFNLADKGYNAMKYLPYGRIEEVIPYLIRRAQENSSVSGEMGREYAFIKEEIERRKFDKSS